MRFTHDDFGFEINDEWWIEAGMQRFMPNSRSYRVDKQTFQNCWELPVIEIEATRRVLSHGVFNNDAETGHSARDRVVSILRGFLENAALPPIEVVKLPPTALRAYRLTHGAHRFYLSVAVGFTHVPVVKGFGF